MKKNNSKFGLQIKLRIGAVLGISILASLLVGVFVFGRSNRLLDEKITAEKEAARPANLNLVLLQDKNCADCFNLQSLVDYIQKQNVEVEGPEIVDISSDRGQELIGGFDVKKIPTLFVKGELNKEASLKDMWPKLGDIKDDTFVLRQIGAPYLDLENNEVHGRVNWITLTDKSCTDCYDPAVHNKILANFGWPINTGEVIDRQDATGQALIQKYNIRFLPTIILQGDVEAYSQLKQIWTKVGTVEADGSYIFREGVKQMGVYKDLTSKRVVKPAPPTTK